MKEYLFIGGPAQLSILLHHYVSFEPYPNPSKVSAEVEGMFVAKGILAGSEDAPYCFKVTEKGTAWIEMILSTPAPVQKWIDPRKPASSI